MPLPRQNGFDDVKNFWRVRAAFCRVFKKSVVSMHIHVSAKHMDRYLREFTFRPNYRQLENVMFDLLIGAV